MTDATARGACNCRNAATGRACQDEPVTRIVVGCVHEHVRSGHLCAHHLDRLRTGILLCARCRSSADPHLCVVNGRETADTS